MDLSKFKVSDWLKIGGAFGFLVFGTFFDWAEVSAGGFSASGGNAFDFFFRGTIPWLLITAIGVITVLLVLEVIPRKSAPWPLIILAAAALAFLLNFLLVLTGPEKNDFEYDRGVGLFLAWICAGVVLAGAVLAFRESGGDFADLKDMNKWKAQFGGGDSTPPPPPPPGGPTPPPPAPPAPPAGGMPPPPPPQ